MSDMVRAKWDARYAYAGDTVPPPAAVLSRHSRLLPTVGMALDFACGLAGNGEWLADRGLTVTAWDISPEVVAKLEARRGSGISISAVRDLVAQPPQPASFDVIVVSRFLDRSVCPAIAAALRPGGVLFYQTFTRGLRNPDYLLSPGELPRLFPTLTVLHHDEPASDATHAATVPDSSPAEAMLVARAARHA